MLKMNKHCNKCILDSLNTLMNKKTFFKVSTGSNNNNNNNK